MAVDPTKKRVMVTLPAEIVDRVDAFCGKTGMNRSGFIGMLLVEGLKRRDDDAEHVDEASESE